MNTDKKLQGRTVKARIGVHLRSAANVFVPRQAENLNEKIGRG
jgi:hypothetical protein